MKCEDYLEQFEIDVRKLSWILLAIVAGSLLFSVVALLLSQKLPLLFPLALLIAGVAGSCATISEVSSSAVSTSMQRTILIRVGTGMTASVVGCALLSWGVFPVAIENITFAEVVNACAPTSTKHCNAVYSLIVLAVPILFGFSERILTTLEGKLLGNADSSAKR